MYVWAINAKGITDNFIVVDIDTADDPSSYDYWLVLKSGSDAIPFGNFFFIFIGFPVIAIGFIYKRKL